MRILGIETSCDETAVAVIEASGGLTAPAFSVRGTGLFSQVALHAEYGGVYPNLAKREHIKNLPPLLHKALSDAGMLTHTPTSISEDRLVKAQDILSKERGLFELFKETLQYVTPPPIDMISVTTGPGLEPALWVGISFARALSVLWDIPVQPTNHMEGHISSVLLNGTDGRTLNNANVIQFPALALLISGGHTELVYIEHWGSYKKIGQTRDDAVGEAFDKVARMLKLPYPGGPEVSKKAQSAREKNIPSTFSLPRPMIHSQDFDFSFSGLKTSVLYTLKDHGELTPDLCEDMCREFEHAVTDVLISKTKRALIETGAQSLVIAGGVIANTHIRHAFTELMAKDFPGQALYIPEKNMATDNAVMIAAAGYIEHLLHPDNAETNRIIRAQGNMEL